MLLLVLGASAVLGCSSSSSSPAPDSGASDDGGGAESSTMPADDAGADDAAIPSDAATDSGKAPTDAGPHGDAAAADGSTARTIDLGILPDYDNAKSNTGGVAGFVSRTGVTPVVISNYMNVSGGTFDTSNAESFIDQALAAGITRVSISLATGDTDVPATPQGQIAAAVAYGVKKGVTVQIRFGYEMNGYWSPSYQGGDPTIFLTTWGEVASAVHGAGGQMTWAPNIVGGGMIAAYATYLPKDTSTIDVVGLDFYHFNGSATDLTVGATEVDDAFATIEPLVKQLGKPFVLTETAVSYFDTSGTWATATAAEVAEKKTWLDQLASPALLAKYPLYAGFFWFDYNKNESSQYRDFSISQQPLEATMFGAWVASNASVLRLGK